MRIRIVIAFLLAGILWLPASVAGQQATPTLPPGLTMHIVQRGETLFRIATNYGTTVDQLVQLNNIADPSTIYVGQSLLVPASGATPAPPPTVMHIVQPGETIDSIAQLYGMSVADLKSLNHLTDDPNSFYVGQLLDVSGGTANPADQQVTEPAPQTTAATTEAAPQPAGTQEIIATSGAAVIHTVQSGETIFLIAKQYGVTVNAIVQANHIANPNLLYAGQDLVIPGMTAPKLALSVPSIVQGFDVEPLVFTEGETGEIRIKTTSGVQVAGTFLNQTLHDATEDDSGSTDHFLLVGIPVGTQAGIYPLALTVTDLSGTTSPLSANIQVVSGNYVRERIQLAPGLDDLLNPTLQNNEIAQLTSITSNFTPTRYFDGLMGLPNSSPLSSPFGNLRSYNGGAYATFHTGTDFAAAPGSPIIAPADGKVVFVGPLDIRGNATIIDHGWGVFTIYCHQTEQEVQVGQMVTAGQIIGTTGSTGRVTGPHLHWELWVDGVPVDAMQWVTESFS
ncbi:MAG TPA: LysM peptidoglycan-binding domain-containing protein [Phototrophicaceae bacterium]|nr:LysM peptidoglycan-binding domain-containing protein [Phototrophicaceae bacterium]